LLVPQYFVCSNLNLLTCEIGQQWFRE